MPLTFATETVSIQALVQAADSILYVGILSSAFTFALMAMALRHIPAPRATVLLATEVLFSVAAGYLFLGERLALLGWLGAALIIAAVFSVRLSQAQTERR